MRMVKKFIGMVVLCLISTLTISSATDDGSFVEKLHPNIFGYFVGFLEEDDLATARLVNKTWRDIFTLPYVQSRHWHIKDLGDIDEIYKFFGPQAIKALSFEQIRFINCFTPYKTEKTYKILSDDVLCTSLECFEPGIWLHKPKEVTEGGIGNLTRLTTLNLRGVYWSHPQSAADAHIPNDINTLKKLKRLTRLRIEEMFVPHLGDLVKAIPSINDFNLRFEQDATSEQALTPLSGWVDLETLTLENLQNTHCHSREGGNL